jgi:cytochrome oxidase Cu insertion factor (SCO1/SenC/PrrC family)/ABC-type Zn2+ transport system substrate-binding protein/surface adhesin
MTRIYRRLPVLLAGLVLFIFSGSLLAKEQFRVVASIKPVHSILAGLMEGTEGPELLVGEGKLPFGYELTGEQSKGLASADVIVWIGPELEKFLIEPLKSQDGGATVVTLLDNPELKILPSRWDESERDPFIWSDSRNMIILVDELAKVLMNADAARAHLYKRNRAALLAKVAELDRRLEYGYRGLKSGIGMAYYDTLQYFEQAYALKIRGVVVQSPGKTVDAGKLLGSRAKLSEGYYSCLITESRMQMPDLPLLLGGIEINRAELDSFGSNFAPGPDLYFNVMDYNTTSIKECLQQGLPEEMAAVEEEYIPITSKIGGKFMLVDHYGKLVTEQDLQGKYQMIYFGYTFCPDICPTSLQVMSLALDMLGDKAKRIQPYFITVDPERDTVKVMRDYVAYFNESLIGLTGTKTMTDRVARQFKVRYEKVIEEGMDPEMYIMDHTASVYLMAPDGTFITKLAHGISAQQMVDKINEYIR